MLQIILDPAKTVNLTFWYNLGKKYLTSSAYYCIIGAPAPKTRLLVFFHKKGKKYLTKSHRYCTIWRVGAKDLLIAKNFCPLPQKRLDNRRTTTYNGARYPKKSSSNYYSGARAPKFSKSQHFFGEWARAGIFILVMGCWHEFCRGSWHGNCYSKHRAKRPG